ncbi:glycoside hydrolase family 105 protein [Schizophyllum amplum]|uniref:Glycoside hydrolase family 105 protein n=1 Tax=Schizophyllum amplum TaxID=97359 RepID=A0A550C2M5_9AGAR|nr:glycoside hydrolase family 105 protein [Auriculariopsis ampla]
MLTRALALTSLLSCASYAAAHPTSRSVSAAPSSYAIWAADSAIARGQGHGLDSDGNVQLSYEHGELQWALRLLYESTGNETYYDYIVSGATNIIEDDGSVLDYVPEENQLDSIRVGPTFLYLYETTGDEKWKTAADTLRAQLDVHPRTEEGQFWHKTRYPEQGWLDGIYMGDIFYAQYTAQLEPDNITAWDDINLQFELMYDNTLQSTAANNTNIGLLYHGYDYSQAQTWASSDRGHSPEIWDRAMGWYMMALVDTLDIVPADSTAHATLLSQLTDLAPKVVAAADPDAGVWWLVMSQPGREGNYFESSGAAMFVYALLKGVREGYVADADGSIVAAVSKAYEYMVDNWVEDAGDGTMNWEATVSVGSLSGASDFDYYISVDTVENDLKGLAAFLLASIEYEQL